MAKPSIIIFFAAPSTIDRGDSSLLTWNTIRATSVTLTDFGSVSNAGQELVSPSSTKTYTLEASNSDGTVTSSKTVTVIPPPVPPPGETYHLIFYTTPGNCAIQIIGGKTQISNDAGYSKFYHLDPGGYTYKVSKDGYVTVSDGIALFSDKTVYVTLSEEEEEPPPEPPPTECPDFWEDPLGSLLCTITKGFSEFSKWFSGSFWTAFENLRSWSAKFTIEFALFLKDPIKYINGTIRTFIVGREQKQATDYTDLRKNEEDHWVQGEEWIAGQYKTVGDLTVAEFKLLVDKGLTDDKEALRAADFRVYKLDASSKAALEQTMSKLRTEVGGLWLGIDSKTGELLDVMNDGHTYVVNYIEALESNLPDTVGDIIQGIGSFVNGGFLDFDTWALQFNLDIAGYTDSKIIDVKEWFNISLPELIEPMFEWAKPIVKPIQDAADWLMKLGEIFTGTMPEDPRIKENIEERQRLQDEIDDLAEKL